MAKPKSKRAAQKRNKQKSFWQKYQHHFALVFVLLALCLLGVIFSFLHQESKTFTIKRHPIQKNLPPEIKRQLTLSPPTTTLHVPILMYHYIEYVQDKKDTERESLNIIPSVFDEQIKTLKDAGYTFMTAAELGDVLDRKEPLPEKPVLITIDDGHWDVDTDILPILKKYNAKATAYIIPGFIGGSDFLTMRQLKDVADSGLVEIGAHTVHHIALAGQPETRVTYEVSESKKMLESDIGWKVVSFAYPYGSFDKAAADIVKQAGFETAVSTVPGIDATGQNRYFLYRIRPGDMTGQELINYISKDQSTFDSSKSAKLSD